MSQHQPATSSARDMPISSAYALLPWKAVVQILRHKDPCALKADGFVEFQRGYLLHLMEYAKKYPDRRSGECYKIPGYRPKVPILHHEDGEHGLDKTRKIIADLLHEARGHKVFAEAIPCSLNCPECILPFASVRDARDRRTNEVCQIIQCGEETYKIEWSESKSAKAVLMDLDDIDDEMDESQSTSEASKQGTADGITQSGKISETLVEGETATWRGSDLQYSGGPPVWSLTRSHTDSEVFYADPGIEGSVDEARLLGNSRDLSFVQQESRSRTFPSLDADGRGETWAPYAVEIHSILRRERTAEADGRTVNDDYETL